MRDLDRRRDRRRATTTTRCGELGTFFGAAVADRRSTTAAAWCSSRSARRSSTCTSRAASARRAARGRAGWCRSCEKLEAGEGEPGRPRAAASVGCDRILGKSLCAARRLRASIRSRATSTKWRDEFEAHIERGRLPVRRRIDASRAIARPEPTHAHAAHCRGARVSTRPRGARHARRSTDARGRRVPKGHRARRGGAQAAGIEIPVFCYEPRLGPPVGACRMCLVRGRTGPPKPRPAAR